jgi:hypothetical protein
MTTLEDRPPTGTASGLRLAAMRCLAGDCTAEELRAWAADTELTGHMARRSGRAAEDIANEMLAVSVVVDMITAEGMTAKDCRLLLRIDEIAPSPALSAA